MMSRFMQLKKYFFFVSFLILPLFLCGCQKKHIVTSTGEVGHRAENLQKMMHSGNLNVPPSKDTRAGVIYLGRDYENNHFGPPKLKFVFEK
ncbi:hypothetical protein IJE86_02045 [bacterium]|nr:hypothetical protein [bacterium]